MPQVILRKVAVANPTAIRTDTVTGWTSQLPVAGTRFHMTAEPIDKNRDIRWVETSPVVEVDGLRFVTESGSIYELEMLEELPDA